MVIGIAYLEKIKTETMLVQMSKVYVWCYALIEFTGRNTKCLSFFNE